MKIYVKMSCIISKDVPVLSTEGMGSIPAGGPYILALTQSRDVKW